MDRTGVDGRARGGPVLTSALAAAIVAECARRGYSQPETLAILTVAIDEVWVAVPAGFFDQLDTMRASAHSAADAWFQIAQLRGLPATQWAAFKLRLYTHIDQAAALYAGKDIVATKDQVAQLIVNEAKARNHTRDECLAEMSALYQESEWNESIWDSTHTTYGVAQQDGSYPHRFEGAAAQVKAFFDKLDVKRTSPGHGDIWLNICWLQQAPNYKSAQEWWDKGRRAYLDEIKSRVATVTPYLDKYWPRENGGTPMTWTGDPVWLEDVLRPALGNKLKTLPGWQNSGHGDFSDIRGVMVHHTGNGRATAQSIRDGRPDLAGPLSNLHIAQDGTVTIVAVGVCWHAGQGSYPWLPTNDGNQHLIGIECAWPMDTSITKATETRERWPDAEIISMRDTCAALLRKLGLGADRVIGHKEYAGAAQGKWDPGNIDMNWFRGEVGKALHGDFDTDPQDPTSTPGGPVPNQPVNLEQEIWDQLRLRWNMLGGKTLVEAVAQIRDKVCGTNDAGKPGVK